MIEHWLKCVIIIFVTEPLNPNSHSWIGVEIPQTWTSWCLFLIWKVHSTWEFKKQTKKRKKENSLCSIGEPWKIIKHTGFCEAEKIFHTHTQPNTQNHKHAHTHTHTHTQRHASCNWDPLWSCSAVPICPTLLPVGLWSPQRNPQLYPSWLTAAAHANPPPPPTPPHPNIQAPKSVSLCDYIIHLIYSHRRDEGEC